MRAVAWVGAGLLFALGALAALTADTRDEGTAFALGAVFGRASITLLIALALRAGYLWIRRRRGAQGALWSPWVLVIAGVIGLVGALAAVSGRADGDSASAESLVGAPPPGFSYERVTGTEAKQLAAEFSELGLERSEVAVRRVLRNGTPVAGVIFFGLGDGDLDDTAAGFRDAGGTIGDEEVEGEQVLVGRDRNGVDTAFTDAGDVVIRVSAPGQAGLRALLPFYVGRD